MKIYFKLSNGEEYYFKSIGVCRKQIYRLTFNQYPSLLSGLTNAYKDIVYLMLDNVRVI